MVARSVEAMSVQCQCVLEPPGGVIHVEYRTTLMRNVGKWRVDVRRSTWRHPADTVYHIEGEFCPRQYNSVNPVEGAAVPLLKIVAKRNGNESRDNFGVRRTVALMQPNRSDHRS